MKTSHDDKHRSTSIEYLIPRCGTVHRVRILGRDELRVFRTELELLRRIARAARSQASTRPVGQLKTLPAESYLELDQILQDATHPLIETTISRIDLEFADLRKDIVMSVVDEEAKNIVTEATEAGMNTPAVADECAAADDVDEMSVDEALDAAQAGLAAAVAGDSSVPAESAARPESASSKPDSPHEDTVAPSEPEQTAAAAIAPSGAEECVADAPSEVEEAVADAASKPVEATDTSQSDASSVQDSSTAHDLDIGAEQVENAVAVIEQGIRNLAATLKGELHEQWTRANNTLDEVNDSRAKIEEERQSTLEMLEEIKRLRDEAKNARDEAEVARRDAKLQRETARVAKERAETSAAIAELAADQAGRDARAFREPELQTVDA